VGGNVNFTSSESTLDDCFHFTELYEEGDIKGSLYCTTTTITVNLTQPSPTPSAENHHLKLAKSEMIGIGVGVAVFGFAVSGLTVFWMLKTRRR
jgi:hypothetical protein